MPVVSRALTHAQREAFNQEHYVKPKSTKELGQEGHWLIDNIDPAGYSTVVRNVPQFRARASFGRATGGAWQRLGLCTGSPFVEAGVPRGQSI